MGDIVLMGPPGSGKGTQARLVADQPGWVWLSTGELFRLHARVGSELGTLARSYLDRGDYVPDDVTVRMVRERISEIPKTTRILFDGFPRTVAQAQALDGIMNGRAPLVVVDIVVPESELVRRLGSRLVCSTCGSNATTPAEASSLKCVRCGGPLVQRSDDNEATVRERLAVYRKETMPLVDYYRARPTFCSVNGAQLPDQVAADVGKAVAAASNGSGAGR